MKRGLPILMMLAAAKLGAAQQHFGEVSLNVNYQMTNDAAFAKYNTLGFGASATYWHRATGSDYWMLRRHNPAFGVRLSYERLPQGVAGDRVGLVGLLSTPLTPWLEWTIGPGVSVFTKYGERGGSDNIFISAPVSCLIDMGLTARLTDNIAISAGVLHASNGMMKRPNQGLNFLQVDVAWRFGDSLRHSLLAVPDTQAHRHEVGFAAAQGWVMSRHAMLQGYYWCYDLSLNYQYYLDPVVAVGATVDLWYNTSHSDVLPRYHQSWPVPMYLSAMPTVEGFWGPVSIKAGIGPIVLSSDAVKIKFYERVGMYYNFARCFVGVGLNANAGKAEFIEWTFGMRFGV